MKNVSKINFEFKRIVIFTILILSYIMVYFHRMAPGVVSSNLMQTFNVSATEIGFFSGMYFYIYAAMQIPSGILADTIGPRLCVSLGNFLAGIGSIIFGLSYFFGMACLGRFLVGLGVSVIFVCTMKNNSSWFSAKTYGLMTGITILVGNIGSISATGPLSMALEHYSWNYIFIFIGVISLLCGVFSSLFVQNAPKKEEVEKFLKEERRIIPQDKHWLTDLLLLIKKKQIWAGFLINLGTVGSLYAMMGLWAISYLRDGFSLTNRQASQYITAMMIAFGVGTFIIGWFSDKIGRRKLILLIGTILYFVMWLIVIYLPFSPGILGLILFALIGFTGSVIALSFPCCKEVVPHDMTGMAVSLANIGAFLGVSLIQPFFGWVLDLSWSGKIINNIRVYSIDDYHKGFFIVLVCAFIGVIGSLLIKETYCKNVITHEEYS